MNEHDKSLFQVQVKIQSLASLLLKCYKITKMSEITVNQVIDCLNKSVFNGQHMCEQNVCFIAQKLFYSILIMILLNFVF